MGSIKVYFCFCYWKVSLFYCHLTYIIQYLRKAESIWRKNKSTARCNSRPCISSLSLSLLPCLHVITFHIIFRKNDNHTIFIGYFATKSECWYFWVSYISTIINLDTHDATLQIRVSQTMVFFTMFILKSCLAYILCWESSSSTLDAPSRWSG